MTKVKVKINGHYFHKVLHDIIRVNKIQDGFVNITVIRDENRYWSPSQNPDGTLDVLIGFITDPAVIELKGYNTPLYKAINQ